MRGESHTIERSSIALIPVPRLYLLLRTALPIAALRTPRLVHVLETAVVAPLRVEAGRTTLHQVPLLWRPLRLLLRFLRHCYTSIALRAKRVPSPGRDAGARVVPLSIDAQPPSRDAQVA